MSGFADNNTRASPPAESALLGPPPEILAPAGSPEAFFAALNAGADAVYLGLEGFNARARAKNFTTDSLAQHLPLARRYGMKVLVALNILVKDVELGALSELLSALAELDVHALIVQDLGVVKLCRERLPGLRLHASTQMALHNAAGVAMARELGLRRAVLARELTAAEIRRIRSEFPREDMELEVFCHGSLCYSYSGLCFFSGAEDARSGNRGECAYTCRKPYRIVSEPGGGFLFSMKDLSTLSDLPTLLSTGVDALKIEGRKKDAQYVMTTVEAYRRALDAHYGYPTLRPNAPPLAHDLHRLGQSREATDKVRQDLALSFNRGETTFFLMGRYRENVIDLDNASHRGIRAGVIENVSRDPASKSVTIQVTLEVDLERFDGLCIESLASDDLLGNRLQRAEAKYHNEVMGFSVRDMSIGGRRVNEAGARQRVTISLPLASEAPWVKSISEHSVGLVVRKTRSASLRARADKMARPGSDDKLMSERLCDLKITIEYAERTEQIGASADGARDGSHALVVHFSLTPLTDAASPDTPEPLLRFSATLLAEPCRAPQTPNPKHDSEASFLSDLRSMFAVLDNGNVRIRHLELSGSEDAGKPPLSQLFVPRSHIKDIKRQLNAAYLEASGARRTLCLHSLQQALQSPVNRALPHKSSTAGSILNFKIDRRSYLPVLASHRHALRQQGFATGDLVLDIKRTSEQPGSHPEAWLRAWLDDISALDLAPLHRIRLAVPTVVRGWDEPLLKRLVQSAWEAGVRAFEIGNLGGKELLRRWGVAFDTDSVAGPVSLSSDFTLFALNRAASAQLAQLGLERIALSTEDDGNDLAQHIEHGWPAGAAPEIILYKDTPLFIAESCSLTALHGGCPTAAVCGYRTLTIEDDQKNRFFVAHEGCKSVVYAEKAFGISAERERFSRLGVSNFRVDFLTRPYLPEDIDVVLRAVASGTPIPKTHPANFNRTLL